MTGEMRWQGDWGDKMTRWLEDWKTGRNGDEETGRRDDEMMRRRDDGKTGRRGDLMIGRRNKEESYLV